MAGRFPGQVKVFILTNAVFVSSVCAQFNREFAIEIVGRPPNWVDFPEKGRDILEGFKQLASDFDVEVWFSALSHRHITDANERGIPHPCDKVDDLFTIIIQLNPTQSGIHLELLKDHDDQDTSGTKIQLDPNTFLAMP